MYTNTRFSSLFSLSFAALSLLGHVSGFAYLAEENHEHSHEAFHRNFEKRIPKEEDQKLYKRQLESLLGAVGGGSGLGGLTGLIPGFSGGFQYAGGPIEVWGPHQFVAPNLAGGEVRGPCPGLNSLANSNYISHDGVVGLFEVVNAINQVFGVGYDLAIANALMAVFSAGDPITLQFSIGGPSPKVGPPLGGLGGIFGEPQGISLAHNFVEADCSLTRNDLFQTGDAWTLDVNLFTRMYYSVPEGYPFTNYDMAKIAARRFHECIDTNPDFYFGPLAGMIVANAAKIFAARLMANYSDPYQPEGVLTHEILKSFFGLVDYPYPFTYNVGCERIPYDWYRYPGQYGLLEFNIDLLKWLGWFPELASIGGNLGAPNTFAGIRLDDSSGIANLPNLFQGNNLICFGLELLKTGSPSFLNNGFKTLFNLLGTTIESIGCPQIGALTRGGVDLNSHLQSIYPGASKAKSGL